LFVHNPLMSLLPSHSSSKTGRDCYFFAFFRSSDGHRNSDRRSLRIIDDEIAHLWEVKKGGKYTLNQRNLFQFVDLNLLWSRQEVVAYHPDPDQNALNSLRNLTPVTLHNHVRSSFRHWIHFLPFLPIRASRLNPLFLWPQPRDSGRIQSRLIQRPSSKKVAIPRKKFNHSNFFYDYLATFLPMLPPLNSQQHFQKKRSNNCFL
jgi:hypothetical protein